MLIEELLEKYGKVDYYEMKTGNIYHLSQMKYHLFSNETKIPVTRDGVLIGEVSLKGDRT